MSARKNRPVLYELVARTERHHARPAGRPGPQVPAEEGQARGGRGLAEGEFPGSRDRIGAEPASSFESPMLEWSRGRLYFSLGWLHLVVVGVVFVAVIAGAFEAGRRSAAPAKASSGTLDDVLAGLPAHPPVGQADKGRTEPRPPLQPPGGSAVTPLQPGPPEPNKTDLDQTESDESVDAGPTPTFDFKPGYSYVVVQYLSRSAVGMKAAEGIRDFLASKGVDCAVHRGERDAVVVVTEPFLVKQGNAAAARQERARADQLISRIKELGKEYNLVGGYSFDKCFLR